VAPTLLHLAIAQVPHGTTHGERSA